MGYNEHKHLSPASIDCAVVIVSDSRTEKDDLSGDFIVKSLTENGHRVVSRCILKNEADSVQSIVDDLVNEDNLQVVIISGGTARQPSRCYRRDRYPRCWTRRWTASGSFSAT